MGRLRRLALITFAFLAFNALALVVFQVWRSLAPVSLENLDVFIDEAAARHAVDPLLVRAVIWRESGFRPRVRGAAGEIGLMQIIPRYSVADWAREHHCKIPADGLLFDPELNVEIGTWYLGRAMNYWRGAGHREYEALALCEYNAGRSRMLGWGPIPEDRDAVVDWIQIQSTREYARSVMAKYLEYVERQKQTIK